MKTRLFICVLIICVFLGIGVYADTDERDVVKVPALMYHCVGENVNDLTVSPENFRMQLETLIENGYTPISLQELVDYVDKGAALPEKPVCITFDDGYTDNYTQAYPILKELNCKATIFAIGSSVGKDTYKNTGKPIFPHFNFEQAKEMTDSGLISVQSHTFDMHQSKAAEGKALVRENLMYFPGENLREYLTALENDVIVAKTLLETNIGKPLIGMAYPMGRYNPLVELAIKKNGIRVSFATSSGTNYVRKNNPDSLYSLNRYNIYDSVTPELLLEWMSEE